MPIPTDNGWRFRLRRTDFGSTLKYNATLKNTSDDDTITIGTPPDTEYSRLEIVSSKKNKLTAAA